MSSPILVPRARPPMRNSLIIVRPSALKLPTASPIGRHLLPPRCRAWHTGSQLVALLCMRRFGQQIAQFALGRTFNATTLGQNRNHFTPAAMARCAKHGAPQCNQPQTTADIPGARAFMAPPPRRVWCRGRRLLGSGSRSLPPRACARACGGCATCAPCSCAKRLGPAVERHISVAAQRALATSLCPAQLITVLPDLSLPCASKCRWHDGSTESRMPCRV